MANIQTIDPKHLALQMQQDASVELIDVRTPAEYETLRAAGARSVPLDQLNPKCLMAGRNGSAGKPLYVICKGGTRSAKACEKFVAEGFAHVVSVAGGTDAWAAAGLPVESSGRRTLPLDRQVHITVGLLCLTGAILGTWVNPWFYLLCAFIGAGLTFAGLTGFCGMAMLLARMPWNKRSATACSGGSCTLSR